MSTPLSKSRRVGDISATNSPVAGSRPSFISTGHPRSPAASPQTPHSPALGFSPSPGLEPASPGMERRPSNNDTQSVRAGTASQRVSIFSQRKGSLIGSNPPVHEADEDEEYQKRFGHGGKGHGLKNLRHLDPENTGVPEEGLKLLEQDLHAWVDPLFAQKFAEQTWLHYNKQNKVMDNDTLQRLAQDTVRYFLKKYRAQVHAEQPKLKPEEVDKSVEIDRKAMLPGRDVDDAITRLRIKWLKDLDKDKDGKISKADFLHTWKFVNAAVFDATSNPKPKGFSCTIL